MAVAVGLMAVSVGCSGPSRIAAPAWDPAANAAKAMELWDTNQDGKLDEEELRQCPGVRSDMGAIDADRDRAISREELQKRLEAFQETKLGLKAAFFTVRFNGKPLSDTEVRFVPEEFLAGIIEPATGKTNRAGVVRPQAESAEVQAMQVGYYRLEVNSPQISTDAQKEAVRAVGTVVEPFSYAERVLAIKE